MDRGIDPRGATERHDPLTFPSLLLSFPPSLPPSLSPFPPSFLQVDVSMNPERAARVRRDLEAVVGKAFIHSIIYTHSHVDHVGGAEAWKEEGTKIWGTDALTEHYFKQYGAFR